MELQKFEFADQCFQAPRPINLSIKIINIVVVSPYSLERQIAKFRQMLFDRNIEIKSEDSIAIEQGAIQLIKVIATSAADKIEIKRLAKFCFSTALIEKFL